MSVASNTAHVQANKAGIYELESAVMDNKFVAYQERAHIEENRSLIMKNYSAAFMGNRQMANMNTDAIFHNREAILASLKVEGQVQVNFRDSKINEAKVDFLDHRSKLTGCVAQISEKMSKINHMLIEVNEEIMHSNQDIVKFNAGNIAVNSSLLDGGLNPASATAQSNEERINSNTTRMKEITGRAMSNKRKLEEVLESAKRNRVEVLRNADLIYERRAEIQENHRNMSANSHKISAHIAGK